LRVVLAEKPSVAADIARVIGAGQRRDGHFSGNGYAVTWAIGHLVSIAEPEAMNATWGKPWRLEALPMIPSEWTYAVLPQAALQFKRVLELFNARETEEIICATDAGREGEHIFRLIYRQTGCTKPVRRLWISSLTDESIRDGFANLKPSSTFDGLAAAASARAHADWLIGMNATRAYTLHNRQLCTVGRVQTPTLALLVQRHYEIQAFRPSSFYEIHATFDPGFLAKRIDAKGSTEIENKAAAQDIHHHVQSLPTATVTDVDSQDKTFAPPQLFDLLTLQKEANQKLGFTATRTLELAQTLYEQHKILSYPRTESRHLSTDVAGTLANVVEALPRLIDGEPVRELALARLQSGVPLGKQYLDDKKLTDHHAIIPTSRRAPASLSGDEAALYDLVVRRFLGIFYADAVRAETTVKLLLGTQTFRATGAVLKEPGWTVLYRKANSADGVAPEPDQPLPPLEPQQVVKKLGAKLVEKQRRPPKPYTDATLLTAMRTAGQCIEDEELAAAMKQAGLGTAATRAEIIEKLIRCGYVERKQKTLLATVKGVALIEQVDGALKNVETTAAWEQKLRDIEDGTTNSQAFEAEITAVVSSIVPQIFDKRSFGSAALAHSGNSMLDGEGLVRCPACREGMIREIRSGDNLFFGCSRYQQGCRFTIPGVIAGKRLTRAIIVRLCERGQSTEIKGFRKKDGGGDFTAALQLTDDLKITFRFDKQRKTSTRTAPL
jgi:DNA topoisomerase III